LKTLSIQAQLFHLEALILIGSKIRDAKSLN
jgi:hypothetical protein